MNSESCRRIAYGSLLFDFYGFSKITCKFLHIFTKFDKFCINFHSNPNIYDILYIILSNNCILDKLGYFRAKKTGFNRGKKGVDICEEKHKCNRYAMYASDLHLLQSGDCIGGREGN